MYLKDSQSYRGQLEHLGAERPAELSALEMRRIEATVKMIPSDVNSVLDVGCGDGRLLRELPNRLMAVGVDYAMNSLRRSVKNGIHASADRLPFADASFDLVLCCEMLEHLPDEMFQKTLRELERVARKHILISVPYKENLRLNHTKCPQCSTVFHIWGHVRRFSNRRLVKLFPKAAVTATNYVGGRDPYHLGIVLYLNQRWGNRWAEFDKTSMCPHCRNTVFTRAPRNAITTVFGAINLLTSRLVPVRDRNWVLKLYSCQR